MVSVIMMNASIGVDLSYSRVTSLAELSTPTGQNCLEHIDAASDYRHW